MLGSRAGRKSVLLSQITGWLFSPPRGTLGQGRNSVPGREKTIPGDSGKMAKTRNGSRRIEKRVWLLVN